MVRAAKQHPLVAMGSLLVLLVGAVLFFQIHVVDSGVNTRPATLIQHHSDVSVLRTPDVTVTPSLLRPFEPISVHGTGFPPRRRIYFQVYGVIVPSRHRPTTSATGTFTTTLRFPRSFKSALHGQVQLFVTTNPRANTKREIVGVLKLIQVKNT